MDSRTRGTLLALAASVCLILATLPGAASAANRHGRHAVSQASCPWLDASQPISTRVSELMGKMTLDQEIFLVEGHGSSNPYVFYEPPIPELCVPQLGEEDGPAGVADGLTGVTELPAGVSVAASFDAGLARRYGTVIGSEEFGKGAAVNLGPTVNIDRDPRFGRSFETFAEDPYLSGEMAASEIQGVQSTGELSQIKHYDDYNQETNRNNGQDDEIVSQRALREIYLSSFELGIAKSHAASVMCSYATINDTPYECEDNALENGVLKTEWGFPGFITSDYGALHDTKLGILSGTDQEQPEDTYYGAALKKLIQDGSVPRSVLNTSISRILTTMFRFDLFNHPPTGTTDDQVTTPAHVAIAKDVATAGTTLLKNDRRVLPISPRHGGTVAVIGPSAAASPTDAGGGSAHVDSQSSISPLQGLTRAAGAGTRISYSQGLPTDQALTAVPGTDLKPGYGATPYGGTYTGTLTAPETGTYVLAVENTCTCYTPTYLTLDGKQILDNPGTPPQDTYSVAVRLAKGHAYQLGITGASAKFAWATPSGLAVPIERAARAARRARTAVVVVSDDTETEAADRLSLSLPSAQDELVSAVAAANPRTVVVVDAGAPVTMPWLNRVSSVLDAWYPGQSNGAALARVVFGSSNPGGHLPVTFPRSLGQVPASTPAQFPGVDGKVQYSEGLQVGYRWYDARRISPLFPFGYGMSYTRFAYRNLRVQRSPAGATGDVLVSATVRNTGSRAGSDVAQAYLGEPAAAGEPPRQLVGFRRVYLAPGQSRRVTFRVTPRQTQWWNETANSWTQSPGGYRVWVGDSSAAQGLPLRGGFAFPTTPGARRLTVSVPDTVTAGKPATATVRLSASGTQTLDRVALRLQLPGGWTARPIDRPSFRDVAPGQAPHARFSITPDPASPNLVAVVHATARLGPDASRQAGARTTVQSR